MIRRFVPPPPPPDDGITELVAGLPDSWDQDTAPAEAMEALIRAGYVRAYYEALLSDRFTRAELAALVARQRDAAE